MIIVAVVLFLVGLVLIIKGSDVFVDASLWVSDATGVSKVVIGATLVSFATTAPEFFVSTIAVIKGHNDMSVGNAVGSISANLGLAFALLALLAPGIIKDRGFSTKGLTMIFATVALTIFCVGGRIAIWEAFVLIAIFALSIYMNIRGAKEPEVPAPRRQIPRKEILINVAKFVGGAAGLILGSNILVDNGTVIAEFFGMPEEIIGLTFVAIGTSLPELFTSITAIIKKQSALSIGNVFGANIIDTTLILATAGFITKGNLEVTEEAASFHLPLAVLLMVVATLPTALGKKIFRWQGGVMIGIYVVYLVFLAVQ